VAALAACAQHRTVFTLNLERSLVLLILLSRSQTHPKYLHSNSTSHVWAFGAIAELVGLCAARLLRPILMLEFHLDNALDASATRFSIDLTHAQEDGKDQFYLSLEDNGRTNF